MIPWILVAELVSRSGRSLGDWVKDRFGAFPSSGEINFRVEDAGQAIDNVLQAYHRDSTSIDETDGASLTFADWRFNLRYSNTEPLLRLNIETKGRVDIIEYQVNAIAELIGGTRA
jgi:phosphomannomutase